MVLNRWVDFSEKVEYIAKTKFQIKQADQHMRDRSMISVGL